MSRQPITLTLQPLFGFTRRVVITLVAGFVILFVCALVAPGLRGLLLDQSYLHMEFALHRPWELFTYPFVVPGLLSLVLACLSLWFFGLPLEEDRGTRWMYEFFFVSTIGGALLTLVVAHTAFRSSDELGATASAAGPWPVLIAMLLVYARLFPNHELRLWGLIAIRAKFLAAGYLLVYLAEALTTAHRLDAVLTLATAACGFLFLHLAPRKGLRFAVSEWSFSLRNRWTLRKRRKAARQFKVYMREQGKDVNMDAAGRYVSLDDEGRDAQGRDPNDRRWMN